MSEHTTRAVIYTENIRNNILEIKKLLNPETKMCIAVKADGYGNGAVITSKIAEECGVDFLAVARVSEAIELRKAGIKSRLLLLSLCAPCEFESLFKHNITPLIFSESHIKALSEAADFYADKLPSEKFAVHLAVDTGMGRIGCRKEEASAEAKLISSSSHLWLEGMGTHFAQSDSSQKTGIEYTRKQYEDFLEAIENVKNVGIDPGICHAGASAISISKKDFHLNMVRPGIIVYGYYPDEITKDYLSKLGIELNLKPVMQFETKVCAIRHFKKGQSISYGRTWTCENETDIAVLPVGYADGLLRRFSPGLKIAMNGENYPVVGRICMDQCMVDIGNGNKNVKVWDRAVIFGPVEDNRSSIKNGALQSAEALAELGKTISYEVLTTIGKRVPRINV